MTNFLIAFHHVPSLCLPLQWALGLSTFVSEVAAPFSPHKQAKMFTKL